MLFITVAMVYIWDTWSELGDRLHSVNLDIKSDSHFKLLVMPCFGFLSLLYANYPEQKCQTMRHVCIKELYILILHSLQRKLDIGANKRQSIFETIAGIGSRQILYLFPILVLHRSRNPPRLVYGFLGRGQNWNGLDKVLIGTIRTVLRQNGGIGLVLTPLTFQYGANRLLVASH